MIYFQFIRMIFIVIENVHDICSFHRRILHPMHHLLLTDRLESELSVDGDCVRRGVNRHF